MEAASESEPPPVEWRFDPASSRPLRLLAHGFVFGIGGSVLAVIVLILPLLPGMLMGLDAEVLVVLVLLILVGGPVSLLYLWPMVTDSRQRPPISAFTWDSEAIPWTKRSLLLATLVGATCWGSLALMGVPFDGLFLIVVLTLFSPVVVALGTTVGSVDGEELVCNGRRGRLCAIRAVRSFELGGAVFMWISYARGTGFLVPRFVTVSADRAPAVRERLESGVGMDAPTSEAEPLVRVIIGSIGLSFIAVALVALRTVDDVLAGLYIGGILGGIGILLAIAGWRGVS